MKSETHSVISVSEHERNVIEAQSWLGLGCSIYLQTQTTSHESRCLHATVPKQSRLRLEGLIWHSVASILALACSTT